MTIIRPIGERHRLELPMIDRPPRRIIPTECLGCGLSDAACAGRYHTKQESCCHICKHEPNPLTTSTAAGAHLSHLAPATTATT